MPAVHAARAVYTALSAVEGITRLEIRLGEAEIEHDGRVTCAQLAEAVAMAGLEVTECREERRALPTL
jgi:copper chaperone CopZ